MEENKSVLKIEFCSTFKEIAELYRFINSVQNPKWMNVVLCICFLLFIVYGLLLSAMPTYLLAIMLVIFISFLFFSLFNEYILAKLHFYRNRQLNGDSETRNTYEISDKIVLKNGVTEYTFDLSDVTGYCEKQDFYILKIRQKIFAFLPKRAFDEESEARFRQMFEGCPEITAKSKQHTLKLAVTLFVCLLTLLLTACVLAVFILK
jgi:hypothetical protein